MAELLWHPAPNPKVGGSTPRWTTQFQELLEESPVFARDVNLCLVKDEKTLNKEAPIQILDKVPLPLVKGIPSPGTKGLHDKAWHSSYPYYADRANCDPPIDNPTLYTKYSEGKM